MGYDQLASSLIQSPADLVLHWLSIIWALTLDTYLQRFVNNKGAFCSAPVLFNYWKISYQILLQAKFHYVAE